MMTTKHSPPRELKAQATKIAQHLKVTAAGKSTLPDPAGKISASLARGSVKFGIVMDDKVVTITAPWDLIRESDEAALTEWILKQMAETGGNPN